MQKRPGRDAIVMVGTHHDTKGGIASVVNVYRAHGLFERWPIEYVPSHADGSALHKLTLLARGWIRYLGLLIRRPTLVHIHLSSRASFWRKLLFAAPAWLRGVPYVVHLHGSEFATFYEQECSGPAKAAVRWMFDQAAAVLTLSRNWQAWVRGISRNDRVVLLFNPALVRADPGASRPSAAAPSILFLGRLGRRKGVYELLEAATRLRAQGLEFVLRLGGDGEVERVRQLAAEKGLGDTVQLLGWVGGVAKDAALDSAHIYVLPSFHEGLPMSILEAMAAGLPIVSTLVGGIPDAVRDGVDGFLIEAGDVDGLADRLALLIASDALRRSQGRSARDRVVATFSADAVIPALEDLYRSLGATPSGDPPAGGG